MGKSGRKGGGISEENQSGTAYEERYRVKEERKQK